MEWRSNRLGIKFSLHRKKSGASLASQLRPCAVMVAKRLCEPVKNFTADLIITVGETECKGDFVVV